MPSLPVVEYQVDYKADAATGWHVSRVYVEGEISQPFRAVLELVTADETVTIDALLGSGCMLNMKREDTAEHRLAGPVLRVECTGRTDQVMVRVFVAPAFALLVQHNTVRSSKDVKINGLKVAEN